MTFDPFMYLSLPLQFASTRSMTIVVFTCDGSAPPTPYTVSVPKQGRCRDLIQALSNACSLRKEERLLIAEVCYKCPVWASIFRCVLSCKQIYIFSLHCICRYEITGSILFLRIQCFSFLLLKMMITWQFIGFQNWKKGQVIFNLCIAVKTCKQRKNISYICFLLER